MTHEISAKLPVHDSQRTSRQHHRYEFSLQMMSQLQVGLSNPKLYLHFKRNGVLVLDIKPVYLIAAKHKTEILKQYYTAGGSAVNLGEQGKSPKLNGSKLNGPKTHFKLLSTHLQLRALHGRSSH